MEPRHVEFVSELEPQFPSVLIEAIIMGFTMGISILSEVFSAVEEK